MYCVGYFVENTDLSYFVWEKIISDFQMHIHVPHYLSKKPRNYITGLLHRGPKIIRVLNCVCTNNLTFLPNFNFISLNSYSN